MLRSGKFRKFINAPESITNSLASGNFEVGAGVALTSRRE